MPNAGNLQEYDYECEYMECEWKIIYNNIDNNIITNNNLLDYDSIFECFTSVKRNKVLNHNSHDYFSDKLTQLTANHSYGGSSHVFGQNFRFFLLLKNSP